MAKKVMITDVTDDRGVLVLAGPRARDVLSACTKSDLSNAAFPWLTAQTATVAGIGDVRLIRVNYVGELGWELHVPMHHMPELFQALRKAGEPHGPGAVRHLCNELAPHGKVISWLGF